VDTTFSIPVAEWGKTPVRLLAWLVEEGESVSAGESIAELGRPGVIGYATAPCAGKVHKGTFAVSSSISAGDVLGWITSASRRAKK
jgi:pyruvate/2-oxoglutarate dehydrogenase complex dihydrolipoamide acyltransferase (E2) component